MPKRRPGLPKVKTGCYTCKFRRVKCGEEKPTCRRCSVFGVSCEGYPEPVKTRFLELHRLAPKGSDTSLQLRRNPHPGTIMTDEENRYFHFFYDELAKEKTAPYHASIWETLIPQMGETEPFLRHATVALGALKKSNAVMNQKPMFSKESTLLDHHHQFAVKAYCKALKGIRESITQNRGDIRSALLASLLAFCFESMEGHQKAATSHAIGGLTLFYKWRNELRISDFMETEDITFAFVGLDLQLLYLCNFRPLDLHRDHITHLNNAISRMPVEFTNLTACRNYLQLITCRNLHFTTLARATNNMHQAHQASQDVLDERLETTDLRANNKYRNESSFSFERMISEFSAEQQGYIEDMFKWRQACARLFQSTGSTPSNSATSKRTEDFVITNSLQIQVIASKLSLHKLFFRYETDSDLYLSDYQAITNLSAQIFPLLVAAGNKFRLYASVLPALGLVVTSCRDREVRLRALGMLLSNPGYEEGIWSSIMAGKVSGSIVILEEPWRNLDGEIPDNQRGNMLDIKLGLKERTMNCQFRA